MPEPLFTHSLADKLVLFPACDPKYRLLGIFKTDKIETKPEQVILNWLVSLPYEIDPAFAAKSVLVKLKSLNLDDNADRKNLVNLLNEIARHPREKLNRIHAKKARSHRRYTG